MKNEKYLLLKGLSKFVEERNIKKIRLIVDNFHPYEIYTEISSWPIEKAILLIRLLPEEKAADLFAQFSPEHQTSIINTFTDEEIGEIFDELFTDEAIDILEELPHEIITRVLKVTDKEKRSKINKILRYEKSSAGYHMTVDYVTADYSNTIKQTKSSVKDQINNRDLEIVDNIWVIDNKKFVGYIKPEALIAESDNSLIKDLIERTDALKTNSSISYTQVIMTKFDISSVPVVNIKNELIGVIEADDLIEIYEDIDDAILEQAAIIKTPKKTYLESTPFDIFKARSFWIIMLLLIGTLTQLIIMGFQALWGVGISNDGGSWDLWIIATSAALATAATISGTAGNTGTQSTSNLIRSIVLNEVNENNYFIAIKKELVAGAMIGFVAAVVAFFRMYFVWIILGTITGISDPFGDEAVGYLIIALVASISFFIAIIVGNLIGTILPILADKYDWDGAIISGPVQTTIVDIFTFTLYLSLTTIILLIPMFIPPV